MKKIKKFIRFLSILITMFAILASIGQVVFQYLWGINLFDIKSYQKLYKLWDSGYVFRSFNDISLLFSLIFLPIFWLKSSFTLYKKGFWKTMSIPFVKIYRKLTRPKNMEVEHVSIKNLGIKGKSLDEIISAKLKEKGEDPTSVHTIKDIRQQISAKLEENKKQ